MMNDDIPGMITALTLLMSRSRTEVEREAIRLLYGAALATHECRPIAIRTTTGVTSVEVVHTDRIGQPMAANRLEELRQYISDRPDDELAIVSPAILNELVAEIDRLRAEVRDQ